MNRKLAGAALAAAVAIVAAWEGLRTDSYEDVIGVWTICYGDTHGVRQGQTASKAECDRRLYERLQQYNAELSTCIHRDLPPNVHAAVISWAYNVGTPAACGSTLVKRLNAGDFNGACNELPRWRYAGGREFKGLLNRRMAERELCLGR